MAQEAKNDLAQARDYLGDLIAGGVRQLDEAKAKIAELEKKGECPTMMEALEAQAEICSLRTRLDGAERRALRAEKKEADTFNTAKMEISHIRTTLAEADARAYKAEREVERLRRLCEESCGKLLNAHLKLDDLKKELKAAREYGRLSNQQLYDGEHAQSKVDRITKVLKEAK